MLEIELKRDAYKYGGNPYIESEAHLNAEEKGESAFEKYVHSSQKAYQARGAFIAYALKNGYDSEFFTYFAMWFVASFGFIFLIRWLLNKMALKDLDRKHKEIFDSVVEDQGRDWKVLVGGL